MELKQVPSKVVENSKPNKQMVEKLNHALNLKKV